MGIRHRPGTWSSLRAGNGKILFSCNPRLSPQANLQQVLVTWILKRYNNELQTSEMFSTAGRTVKSGLVASAVVSSWTWAATLLQSSSVAYNYGVSGPFWYASGATVQILLFASIAIELKRRAPNAHTFLEVIKARFGTVTHM
jgi:Na+/proline symporter